MRLIATFQSEQEGRERYIFLLGKKIPCHLETTAGKTELWITSEDQTELAKKYLAEFVPPPKEEAKQEEVKEESPIHKVPRSAPPPPMLLYSAHFTRLFVFLCIFIFGFGYYQSSSLYKGKHTPIPAPAPIEEKLLYDAPEVLSLMREFNIEYVEGEGNSQEALLKKIENAPYWKGIYPILLSKSQSSGPLFIKIREGEVWRVITPIFLHGNLIHILFNMLWLWLLGKMVEHNVGALRYLFFVLVAAAITNTAQYLMSGFLFMGFSGVLSAMAGFIWVRKKKAPWEIYPIDFGTLSLLGIFIFGFLAVQIVVFFLQFLHIIAFDLPLANTAHVLGVFVGMGFGHLKLFKSR